MKINGAIIDWDQVEMYNPAIGRKKLGVSAVGGNVPAGGTTGQVLVKLSNADFDVGWATIVTSGVQVTSGHGPPVGAPATSVAIYFDEDPPNGQYVYYAGAWH